MKNLRSYYSSSIKNFLAQPKNEIIGIIHSNNISFKTNITQSNSWDIEIDILKKQLQNFNEGRIIFEYVIPRMGKRIDTVIIYKNIIFYDYALDLRNFHKESHNKLLVPLVISTNADSNNYLIFEKDRIIRPIPCNSTNISKAIIEITIKYHELNFDYLKWENSEYFPTPTIIEAAQALYRGHNVHDITRSDAGAENLTVTTNEINKIIEYSKLYNRKSICFITGVPGAGKTLVGLNIAIQRSNAQKGEHAVFLSGNFPLVTVLQEALARDKVEQEKEYGNRTSKKDALRSTSAFIQIIHKYRDSFVGNNNIPPERIAIFDEAQRAWSQDMIKNFMSSKKRVANFSFSEPEFLISTMDRHHGWAVIICLVGGGQEINNGEAGLPEWFDSLRRTFSHWDIYLPSQLKDDEYRYGRPWEQMIAGLTTFQTNHLHLATSIRSFRTPSLAAFIKALLDADTSEAKRLYLIIKDKYPIVITRDLHKARAWVRAQSQGSTRYGLLASSGALRLKPEGVFVKNTVSVENWFLNDKDDVRSSYMLEDVVTEFDIQGLELDYSLLAWDADYRFTHDCWTCHTFKGTRWTTVKSDEKRRYLKNAYRVLLTRARQGMVIFVPVGSDDDLTRKREYYDGTYDYLAGIGLSEL